MPGVKIADVFMKLLLESRDFQSAAVKEGEKAGDATGKAMSKGISGQLGNLFKGGIFAGAGIELGRQAIIGLERAVGAVINVIPDMIQRGQDFALVVDDLSDKTGASAETASRFAGTLTYLGIATSGLGMSLRTLSGDIVNNEDKFKRLGIQTRDSNGDLLDTITILGNVRSYLSGAGDGAAKMALAADLLGRSAGDLIDYLNLTNEQAAFLDRMMDNLAVTLGSDAVKAAESLTREQSLLRLAWLGLSNVLDTAVVPAVRQVIGGIIELVSTHGPQLRQMLADATNAVLGFVSALLGLEGVTPFQMQLDSLAGSTGNVTLSFEQWAQQTGRTIPVVEKATGATKAATGAIDAQIKSIDRQIERSKAAETAAENQFGRTMTRLGAVYQAQLDALDLTERQDAAAQRAFDLNERLNQAQLDLVAAQKGDKGVVDAEAVSDAMKAVADIRAEQARAALQAQRDDERARLQSTKDFIAEQATLATDTTVTQTTKVKTFTHREEVLTGAINVAKEKGDAATVADLTARLEAVKTARARTEQANRATDRQAELGDIKAQLEAQRAAIAASGAGQVTDDKKKLAELTAQYDVYLADQKLAIKDHVAAIKGLIEGDPKTGTGLGGSMSKAFADGKAGAQELRRVFDEELKPALLAILGIVTKIGEVLGDQGLTMAGGAVVGARIGGPPGAVIGGAVGGIVAAKPGTLMFDPGGPLQGLLEAYDAVFGTNYSGTHPPAKAAGGPVLRGQPFIGNERRQEFFVPHENGTIIPSLDALRGWMGGGDQTIEVPVYLDGDVLTRVVSRRQADEYHH